MTLTEIQMEINDRSIGAGETAKPIYRLMGGLALVVQAIDQRTAGGKDTATLQSKIAELEGLLDYDAKIFQSIEDIVGGNLTPANLPAAIQKLKNAAK